ncbi:hypothetical protein M378DRAFT_170643 [Amanita muscaria Koide BX008]|uniref:Uncharacterized protein n=1 Tax=Amanita muscaria (strain Koide BX008) TaxID=946122 RepID=A0A0C2WAV3_AMAMK|nr:hypothetical protein M378DRAFT_170643 [Amanita muscaria Koide BX008]
MTTGRQRERAVGRNENESDSSSWVQREQKRALSCDNESEQLDATRLRTNESEQLDRTRLSLK